MIKARLAAILLVGALLGGMIGSPSRSSAQSSHIFGIGDLKVTIQVSPNPTKDGTATTITAKTSSGASCIVQIRYASGTVSTSKKLATTQVADSHGLVSWTFTPHTKHPGPTLATVACAKGSKKASATLTFTISG